MKRWLLALFSLALIFPSAAFAQKKPKENAQVLVTMKAAGYGVTLDFGLRVIINGEWDWPTNRGTYRYLGQWATPSSGWTYSPGGCHMLLTPGVPHTIGLFGSWQYGEVKVSVPAGYRAYINDQPVDTWRTPGNAGGGYSLSLANLVIRAEDPSADLPAGEAVAPRVGDLVWQISAGTYSNGMTAGSVQWRTNNLSASLLSPTSLTYSDLSSPEVATTWHSDGGLLELRTFQFVLHVRRNPSSGAAYEIETYNPYVTRTGSGDGPYSYSSAPDRIYRISNPNGSTWNNQIRIEKIAGSSTETWTLAQNGSNWTVVESNSLRVITRTSSGTNPRVEIVEVKDAGNNVAIKLRRTYQPFGWGQEEMIEEVANPDSLNGTALTTTYDYHTAGGTGGYGRLKSVTNSDGSWVRYAYDDSTAGFGNLAAIYRPWQDDPGDAASATATNCHATLFGWVGERNVFDELPAGTETKILGVTTARSTISYSHPGNAPNGHPLRTETHTSYTAASASLTTTRTLYNPFTAPTEFLGRLYAQTNPDGTKISALRYKGYFFTYGDNNATNLRLWDPPVNNTWGEYRFHGFSTAVQDSVPVNSWDGQSFETVHMVPNRSTVELNVFDDQGRIGWTVRYVFTGATSGAASFEFVGMDQFGYAMGQHTYQQGHNGFLDQRYLHDNGWLSGFTSNNGAYTQFTRDALGREYQVHHWDISAYGDYPAHARMYTHKTYDIANRVLTEKVSDSVNAADPGLLTTRTFNVAGQLLSETGPSGLTTTFTYTNGGRTTTTTLPGGATQITDRYRDGSVKSVTGSAVVHSYQSATVNGDGTITRTAYAGPSGVSSLRWIKVTTDWAGRTIKEEQPAPSGATPSVLTKQYHYNSVGQLTKTTETNLADTLVTYNAWQQAYRTGLDLNANGTLDLASSDRITESETIFEKDGSTVWWSKVTSKAYNVDNSATPVVTAVTKTRLHRFTSNLQSQTVSTDIFGNTTTRSVTVDRTNHLVTETIDYPDSTTDVLVVSRDGLLQKKQTKEGLVYRTYYDSLRRPTKVTDPRTDPNPTPARIGYHGSDTGQTGQIAWRQDTAGNQTSYTYDSATGRLSMETNAQGKATRYAYTPRGELYRTWGDTVYPVEYAFSDYGEQETMKTFRGGTGWTGATWPAAPGTADTTTWTHDPATGALTSKMDAENRTVNYTYTARGQLKTRTWARGVITTYTYSATTGEQTNVDYSDSTPDLTYTYNRLGQTATITDVTGTRTFQYSATTTALTQEDLGSFAGTRSIARTYDALGRAGAFFLGPTSAPTSAHGVGYSYDAFGRPGGVWTVSYTYATNSNLLSSISDVGSGYTQTRTYEPNRDLLDTIETKWNVVTKAKFEYSNDALGRRTAVAKTGEMFSRYAANGLDTLWGYSDRSEVMTEVTKLGGTATVLTGRNDAYSYDSIGNRAASAGTSHNGNAVDYTANALNQYTQRTVPGVIDVAGVAPASATVTINGSSAGISRHGDYYYRGVSVTSTTPVWQSLSIASSLGGSSTRKAFVPLSFESFSYDHDGNLLSDGRWDYTYDAENRLVAMQTHAALSPSPLPDADARRLEFKYDYLGRRVQKTVRSGWNGTGYLTVESDTRGVFDGWNLVHELDTATTNIVRTYIWGLDWSGTLQGAGGVGGLLRIYDIAAGIEMMPAYDGNGNVMALLKRTDNAGALVAAYEYDAFGQTLRESGSHAAANPFRFSTKYTDTETNLVYYGHRYYSPWLGRFICRDPKEEDGGRNLYAFLHNNSINHVDLLGWHSADDYYDGSRSYGGFGGTGGSGGGGGSMLSTVMQMHAANNGGEGLDMLQRLSGGGRIEQWLNEDLAAYETLVVTGQWPTSYRPSTTKSGHDSVGTVTLGPLTDADTGEVIIPAQAPNSGDTPSFVPAPRDLLGTSEYYAWRNANTPESYQNDTGPNYLTEFAPKYFNKFVQLDKDWGGVFPGIHKWVNATKLELQLALEAQLRNNPALQDTRADLMRAAFRTHPDAYRQGFFGELTYLEKSIVALHLDRNDMMAAGWGTAIMTVIDSRDFFLPSERDFKVFGPFRKP